MPEVYRTGAPADQRTEEHGPPSRKPADWVLDVVAVLALVGAWVVMAVSWGSLPDRAPQHFGLTGQPDAWGGRGAILIGPSVATAFALLFSVAMRWRRHFRYPVEIRPDNLQRQEWLALRLLRWERAALAGVMAWDTWQQGRVARGEIADLGVWNMPLTLALLIVPLAVYWVHARRVG